MTVAKSGVELNFSHTRSLEATIIISALQIQWKT